MATEGPSPRQRAPRRRRALLAVAGLVAALAITGIAVAALRARAPRIPGVPYQVHALGGDGSATVTWSGPGEVDGSPTTSFTVTASSGQQVVAHQPNHWAIISGLPDGHAVRFRVAAASAAGTGAASADSNAVTPRPLAEPRHVLLGRPAQVTFDQYSLRIGGRRVFIYSGEFDPWRLPSPSLWLDRLEEMKAAGFNAVTVYFNWDYTSPAPGVYNFTGVRDVNLFLNDAQQVGLYVIARPGPYINAETDGGGLPGWLVTQSGVARTPAPDYLAAAEQWLSAIDPIIAAHQITRGGDVILYQVENELRQSGGPATAYMQALVHQVRADGIVVPLTNNSSPALQAAGLDITGSDVYPLGFNCADTTAFGNPPTSYPRYPGQPPALTEFQGGSFDYFGSGFTYAQCRQMTGAAFENVFYKANIIDGITLENNYMTVGGTDWGWLPATSIYPATATGYTSYDYGAAIGEAGQLTSKYSAQKLIAEMTQAVAPLTKTAPVLVPPPSNPGVYGQAAQNPTTGTVFLYLRQANAASTSTVTTRASFSGLAATVPIQGTITLRGREAKLLIADWTFGHQDLVYSTSEVATQARESGGRILLLYGDAGTDGETVLHYASRPAVDVLAGSVQSTWDGATGDLRLDYVHQGLAEVRLVQGGHTLLLLIGTHTTAGQFWIQRTSAGTVLERGSDLVRTAGVRLTGSGSGARSIIGLTGDTKAAGPLQVWAPAPLAALRWNGQTLHLASQADGSVKTVLPGPPAVTLPSLSQWRFAFGSPERLTAFNDSAWPVANHMSTTNPTAPLTLPVLYADDYGFHHGFIWYRGSFTATAATTGIQLTADGGAMGAFSVWLNGVFLGSNIAGGARAQTFAFPRAALKTGGANVVAVLVENMGHQEDSNSNDAQKRPRGLLGAALLTSGGAGAPTVTWRLQGNTGGTVLPDPVRGVMNPAGLYGSNHGWQLPGYPDATWTPVSLPDAFSARGLPPGVGWYRTTFSLHLPQGVWEPLGLHLSPVHGGTPGAGRGLWQAFVYLNGWLIGRYVNYLGPQSTFYLPQGILQTDGSNTLAIAVWDLEPGQGGLGPVSLVPYTVRAGGIPVASVPAPAFTTALYGPAVLPSDPVLALSSAAGSTVAPGQTVRIVAQVTNAGAMALQDARLSLGLPAGWSAPGGTVFTVGALAAGASRSLSVTIRSPTLPAPGSTQLSGTLSYRGQPPGASGPAVAAASSVSALLGLSVAAPLDNAFSPATLLLAPRGVAPSTLSVTNNLNAPVTFTWSASAPAGVTVTPGHGTLALAAGATATATLQVGAAGTLAAGAHAVTLTEQATASGSSVPTQRAVLTVDVPQALDATFDNTGISQPAAAGGANFDASGYSFPEPALVAAGAGPGQTVHVGGLSYTMPAVPAGQPDNTLADGQVVAVSGQGTTLGLLEASGGVVGGSGTITASGRVIYADGSTASFSVNFGNYYYPAAGGNVGIISVPYLDNPSGTLRHTAYIFSYTVPIDPAKTVVAVQLPRVTGVNSRGPGAAHIFALAIGTQS